MVEESDESDEIGDDVMVVRLDVASVGFCVVVNKFVVELESLSL